MRKLAFGAAVLGALVGVSPAWADDKAAGTSASAGATQAVNGSVTLAKALEAHGGLDKWRAAGTLKYTLVDFPLTEQLAQPHDVIVDVHPRKVRIDSEKFAVVHDGTNTWASPSLDYIGLPPRLFAKGSTYFLMMPFVFADPGVNARDVGTLDFNGKTYDDVAITYNTGVGDVDDDFHLMFDRQTHQLAAIHHTVKEAKLERVTWTFDEWKPVGGLLIPAKMTFRPGFTPVNPPPGKQATLTNASISNERPDPKTFTDLPAGAVKVPTE